MGQFMRSATVQRTTKETDIAITVNLDGTGDYAVSTGIGFLDHMVEQLSRHSLIDISMTVKGDLHIDQHHTVEDSALALGEAVAKALGDKPGNARNGVGPHGGLGSRVGRSTPPERGGKGPTHPHTPAPRRAGSPSGRPLGVAGGPSGGAGAAGQSASALPVRRA